MEIVRETGLQVECGGCYWYNEYHFSSDAIAAFHAVDDVLSDMINKGIIGEYKVTLSNKKIFRK